MSNSDIKQAQCERLSALLDGELNESEIQQSIDELLNNPELLDRWGKNNLIKDALHDQLDNRIFSTDIVKHVSEQLVKQPAHFVEHAVELQQPSARETHWLHKLASNRVVSGLSVAASVMIVSLYVMQHFALDDNSSSSAQLATNQAGQQALNVAENENQQQVSNIALANNTNNSNKVQYNKRYQWVEADPDLSRKIHEYVNEHKFHSSVSPLQPKIRMVSFQKAD